MKLPVFLKPKPKHTSWLSLHSLIKASHKGSTDSGEKKTDLPLDWKKNINVRQWEEFLTTIFKNGIPSVPISPQFGSVTQSCPTLWDPMDCSTPGLHVHHHIYPPGPWSFIAQGVIKWSSLATRESGKCSIYSEKPCSCWSSIAEEDGQKNSVCIYINIYICNIHIHIYMCESVYTLTHTHTHTHLHA